MLAQSSRATSHNLIQAGAVNRSSSGIEWVDLGTLGITQRSPNRLSGSNRKGAGYG